MFNIIMKSVLSQQLSGFYGNHIAKVIIKRTLHVSASTQRFDDFKILKEFSKYEGGSVDLTKDNTSGLAVIKLNNPKRRNALTGKMMVDLADAVSELETWKNGKALILCGTDNYLCSGGDFTTVEKILNRTDGEKMCKLLQNVFHRLYTLPLISVSLVQGTALGGGAELITATDFRVWDENAAVGFLQIKLGVLTGWGGGTRLVNLLGRRKSLDLISSGRIVKSNEALNIGLADHVLDINGNSFDGTKLWLSKYISGTLDCVRGAKQIVTVASEKNITEAYEEEKNIFATVWGAPAHKEAIEKAMKKK